VFSVELTFKIAGRDVTLEEFAEKLVARAPGSVRKDIQTLRIDHARVQPAAVVQRDRQPRAIGIERAAELLSISPYTVRRYVAERKLHSIRAGRRVLIPMETVEKVLQEGFSSSRR
jgi:excisionase family DNA binding protein